MNEPSSVSQHVSGSQTGQIIFNSKVAKESKERQIQMHE